MPDWTREIRGRLSMVRLSPAREAEVVEGDDPIGQTAIVDCMDRIVVGVVADAVQGALESAPVPEVYLPLNQARPSSGFVAIRSSGDPYALLPALRTAVLGALPNVPVRYVATMNERIAQQTAQRRLTMLLLGLFGVLACSSPRSASRG
jgi:hypothetical protein